MQRGRRCLLSPVGQVTELASLVTEMLLSGRRRTAPGSSCLSKHVRKCCLSLRAWFVYCRTPESQEGHGDGANSEEISKERVCVCIRSSLASVF